MAVSVRGTGAALEGGPELDRMLKGLGGKAGKKIVRSAVTQAIKIPMARIKANFISMVGGDMGLLLSSNLQSRAWRRQRSGSFARYISLKPNVPGFEHVAADGKRTYIPAAIELGHDDVAPVPAMRVGAEATKEQTERRLFRLITAGILRFARTKRAE